MKICMVSLQGLPYYAAVSTSARGGAEAQTEFLAESLAARGHDVSVVLTDYDPRIRLLPQAAPLTLRNAYHRSAGVAGLRFLPRWMRLNRTLKRADADVFFQMCGGAVTGQLAVFCGRARRGFVYATASDGDVDPRRLQLGRRDRWLYEYGIRHADRLVTQHRGQAEELRRNYGLESTPIAMATRIPAEAQVPEPHPIVLWLGTVRAIKRPERYLALARRFPEARFVMVGGRDPKGGAVFDRTEAEAKTIPNVEFLGPVADVEPLAGRAWVLLNTSDTEGFPTTFLEAWARGVPTVSIFDPGGLIREQGIGVLAADEAGLSEALRSVLQSRERRDALGARAREYVTREHSTDVVVARFERELAAAARAHGRG